MYFNIHLLSTTMPNPFSLQLSFENRNMKSFENCLIFSYFYRCYKNNYFNKAKQDKHDLLGRHTHCYTDADQITDV